MDAWPQSQPLTLAVAGSSGFVGSALCHALESQGHVVCRLGRQLDPCDVERLAACQAVINLAGEPIMGRWTAAKKKAIYASRVEGTRRLGETLLQLNPRPEVWINASAVGIYGDRGSEVLDESSALGQGFLADVARDWEAATAPARQAGLRVVCLRLGMVLGPGGGALAKMVPAFKLGLGGVVGKGSQYWSWISLDDVVGAICFAITHKTLVGPVNAVSPTAVTQKQFAKTLGQVLHRPAWVPLPRLAARLAFGAVANETLLASTRVVPSRLQEHGYVFEHVNLASTLHAMIHI